MTYLINSSIWRGGASTEKVAKEKTGSLLLTPSKHWGGQGVPHVRLQGEIASKGGGATTVVFCVDGADFAAVIDAMYKIDPVRTFKAVAAIVNQAANSLPA